MHENARMRRFTTAAVMSCVFVLHDGLVTAQSSATVELARASFTSVHQYVAGEAIPTQLAAPPNITVPPMYRPLVETMLRGSPTFRRQCLRLAAEPSLTVLLEMNPHALRSDARAKTRMTRNAQGDLVAIVEIAPLGDTQELIAHEFEHIIEQLDGVDLAAHAAQSRTGVSEIGSNGGVFETVRAQRMGLKVVSELRQ